MRRSPQTKTASAVPAAPAPATDCPEAPALPCTEATVNFQCPKCGSNFDFEAYTYMFGAPIDFTFDCPGPTDKPGVACGQAISVYYKLDAPKRSKRA